MLHLQAAKNLEGKRFLRSLRAAGDPHELALLHVEKPAEFLRSWIAAIGVSTIILDRTGNPHPLGHDPQRTETLGIFLGLHQKQVDMPQKIAGQAAEPGIALAAARTHSAVDYRHPNPARL